MATITKKELIDKICDKVDAPRSVVRGSIQAFLDGIVAELVKGNRLEFRDFGVFETRLRSARKAQNPKTLAPVDVLPRRAVKFKAGRLLRDTLDGVARGPAGEAAPGPGAPQPGALTPLPGPSVTPGLSRSAARLNKTG